MTFTVPGMPKPKERARRGVSRRTGKAHWYTPDATSDYQAAVRTAWLAACPGYGPARQGPFVLTLRCYFPRPNRWTPRGPEAIPTDTDNVTKAIKDALNGGPYVDDRQVVAESASKDYAEHGSSGWVGITLEALTPWLVE